MKRRTNHELAEPTTLRQKSSLSNEEAAKAAELRKLEQQYYKNLADNNYLMCSALLTIHRRGLYRMGGTFEACVSARFGLSRPHAYSRIYAGETYEALMNGNQFDVKDLPSIAAAEKISGGVARWIKANIEDGPEHAALKGQLMRGVYNLVFLSAQKDRNGEIRIPPATIKNVFTGLMEVARTP